MLNKANNLAKIIFLLTGALMFLPLLIWRGSAYPFIYPKVIWLQVFTSLIFVFYLILVLYHFRLYKPRFSYLGMAVLLFYLAVSASVIFSTDFKASFWSRSDRMLGYFQMIHYFILFLVWRTILDKESWFKLWRWFVFLGSLVPLISVIQYFAHYFFLNSGSERVVGTLGNPIYTAGFCIFTFFSAWYFYRENKSKIFGYFWLIEMFLSVLAILATQSRGALVALLAGLSLWLLAIIFDKQIISSRRKLALVFLGLIIFSPLILVSLSNTNLAENIPIIRRFELSSLGGSTGQARLMIWKVAFAGWQEHPWFGWGWENFYNLANKNYQPQLLVYGHSQEWFDNAHNMVINLLGTTGIFGVLSYLLVYFYAVIFLIKKYFISRDFREKNFALSVSIFLIAHFIQNLFVFENISSYLVFFWMIAGIDIIYCQERVQKKNDYPIAKLKTSRVYLLIIGLGKMIRFVVIVLSILAISLILYRFTYIPTKADHLNALSVQKAMVDFKSAIDLHRQAVRISPNPYQGDIAFEFGQFILVWLGGHPDFAFSKYRDLAKQMHDFGIKALGAYLNHYPDDPRAVNILALAYLDGFSFWQDINYLDKAESLYFNILPTNPNRQTLLFGLIKVELAKGNWSLAKEYAAKAVNLNTDIGEARWFNGLANFKAGDINLGYVESKKAIELGWKPSQQDIAIIFPAFEVNDDVVFVEPLIKVILDKNPKFINRQLLSEYTNYLKKTDRASEAEQILLKYQL